MNPIEKCWAQAKQYTHTHANYTIQKLRTNVPVALDSVTVENITNYFRKVRRYMFAYLKGITGGSDLGRR